MSGKQNGFSKIPLARKIEALVLTAVTVIASMSVDWSSLTARAVDGAELNVNCYTLDTTTTTAPSITMTIGGYEGDEHAGQYKAIKSAYMNVQIVSGSADYVATVYQNPTDPDDYTTGVANEVKTGTIYSSTDNTDEDPEPFQPKQLWAYDTIDAANGLIPPVYLSSTETATIVVTFSNISEGAQIQYGTDSGNNPFELSEEAVNSFDDARIISKISQITAVADSGQTYDLSSNNIYLEPAYNRTIDLTLLSGIKTAGQITVSNLDSITKTTNEASLDDNNNLTPLKSGENTIVAFSGANWIAIPLRVVDPQVNFSTEVYTGSGYHISEPVPVCGTTSLTSGTDFYATYSGTANDGQTYTAASADQITKAGKYTVTLTGAGNYAGLDYTSHEFTINPRDLSNTNTEIVVSAGAMVIDPATREVASYAGALTDNGTPLILGTDYTAEITRDQTSATKFSVKITGINNYSGERTFETTATTDDQIDLNTMVKGLMLTASQSGTANVPYYAFDGKPHNEPGIFFYDDEAVTHRFTLCKNTDYAYSIEDSNGAVVYDSTVATSGGAIEAGDYTVKIRGLGSYKGTISSRDYLVSDGTGGTRPQVLTIAPTKLTPSNIIVKLTGPTQFVANGKVQQPSGVTVDYVIDAATNTVRRLNEGVDYTKEFPQSVTKGNYSVKITGMGNFTADSVDFSDSTIKDQINPASNVVYTIVDSLDAATITLKVDTQAAGSSVTKDNADPTSDIWASAYSTPYDGDVTKKPVVTVNIGTDLEELKSDNSNKDTADYQVIYNTDSSKKAGTATLTVRGLNRFAGQPDITVSYTITPKALPALTITSSAQPKTYSVSGSGIRLDPGEYSVTDDTTPLTAANLTSAELAAPKADDIAAKYPDADYYVTYENNKDQGVATVTAHGINNYTGESTATFVIAPLSFTNNNDFTIDPIPDQSYNYGAAVEPDKNNPDQVVVKYKGWYTLVKGQDYTVSYTGNTDKGKATVKVTGEGNFAGDLTKDFTIKPKSLVDTTITYTIGGGTNKKTGTVETQNIEPGYLTEYTGGKIKPAIELKSGATTLKAKGSKNVTDKTADYELDYGNDTVTAVGDHTITVKGLNNYAGNSIIFTYTVTRKDFSTESFVVEPVTTATSTSIVAGVGAIKRYYQVRVNGKVLTPRVDANNNKNATYDYSVRWTEPGASTTKGSDVIPYLAGEGYTLQIIGRGNYKGTSKPISLDSKNQKLMVGASLDANEIIELNELDGASVPFYGSNWPVVYLDTTVNTLKQAPSGGTSKNTDIVVSGGSIGAVSGPSYTNGLYNNSAAKDYTVHFVPETTTSKSDPVTDLSSVGLGTKFKLRVDAVAGSTLFFDSHLASNTFTVTSRPLSKFNAGTWKDYAGQLKASDTAAAKAYVVSNGSVDTTTPQDKISYEYTGSTITPHLSVTFQPVSTSSDFTGTFAPIDLLTYATVTPGSIAADVTRGTKNFTLNHIDGSGFTGSLDIPYEVTQKEITADMASLQKPTTAGYNGNSHKDEIIPVVKFGPITLTQSNDFGVAYFSDEACTKEISTDTDPGAFTRAGKIYVKITSMLNSNYTISGSSIKIPGYFEITPKSVNDLSISLNGQDETENLYVKYTGSAAQPTVKVADGTTELTASTNKDGSDGDYYYSPSDPNCLTTGSGIGVKTVTIYGKNNYAGTQKSRKFYVYGDLTDSPITTEGITEGTYILNDKGQPVEADSTGETIKSGESPLSLTNVKFKAGDTELTSDSYTVSVTTATGTPASESSLQYPGKYIVTYKGAGESKLCTGTRKFIITVKGDLTTAEVRGINSVYPYSPDASKERPDPDDIVVQLASSGYKVSRDDYIITYNPTGVVKPNTNDGDITLEIKPKSDTYYIGKFTKSYDIKYNLEEATIEKSEKNPPVIGDTADDIAKKNKITVTVADETLNLETNYLITSADWDNANKTSNTASLTITIGPDNGERFSYNTCEATLETEKKSIAAARLNKDGDTISYDGKDHLDEQNKAIKVNLDKKTLKLGEDYAITWHKEGESEPVHSLTDAGTYKATIKGVYQYNGEASNQYTLTISQVDLSGANVEPKDANQEYYTGKEPALDYNVTVDGLTLTQDEDFTAEITSPNPKPSAWDANTAVTVTIQPKSSNFTGSKTYTFKIQPIDLSKSTKLLSIKSEAVYNGKEQKPKFRIVRIDSQGNEIPGGTLTETTDYTISTTASGFVNAGKYPCTIEAASGSNYTGSIPYDYEIAPRSLVSGSGISVNLGSTKNAYTGNPVEPVVTVKDEGIDLTNPVLTEIKDYTVNYENNTASHADSGDDAPVAKIIGQGNYTGEVDKYFQIGTDISSAAVTLSDSTRGYDGTAFRPTVTSVKLGSTPLTATTDYTGPTYTTEDGDALSASEPTAKGTYKATVTGTGAYFGKASAEYTITAKETDWAALTVKLKASSAHIQKDGDELFYYYSGQQNKPDVEVYYDPGAGETPTLLTGGEAENAAAAQADWDYYLTYGKNTNAGVGAGTVTVHLINNYQDSDGNNPKTESFDIRAVDISDTSKFKLTFDGNTKVAFTGDEIIQPFTMSGTNAAGQKLSVNFDAKDADTLKAQADAAGITATWSANIAPGTAHLRVTGTDSGNFTGGPLDADLIIKGNLSTLQKENFEVSPTYRTGSTVTPAVKINFQDNSGEDHYIDTSWFEVNATPYQGTWQTAEKLTVGIKVTSAGKDFLEGTRTVDGKLTDEPQGLTISGYNNVYSYTGAKLTPESDLKVMMDGGDLPATMKVKGFNFYSSKDGTACVIPGTVTMSAIVTYTDKSGTEKEATVTEGDDGEPASYRIIKRAIKNCTITGIGDMLYDGKAHEPDVKVSAGGHVLERYVDYNLAYSGNKDPGTATITVKATKNADSYFVGQTTVNYTIYVANVTGISTTSSTTTCATASWKASSYVNGYKIVFPTKTGGVKGVLTTKTSYTMTDLDPDDSTQVQIQAYVNGSDGKPAYYGPVTIFYAKTILPSTTATVSATSTGINTISWAGITNAQGYEIWRSTSADTGYVMLTTARSAVRSYVDQKATSGVKYYYRVRGYKYDSTGVKYGYSDYSPAVYVTTR